MKISVITPVFNAIKYLPDTYNCLLQQTHEDWEWIVTDDQSTDGSFNLMQEYARTDERIRIFQNPINSGPSVCRNVGLKEAKGVYIAFLDADDVWLPEKLTRQSSFLQENNGSFSCHDYDLIEESGRYIKTVHVPSRVTLSQLDSYNPLGTSFIMIKQDLIGSLRFRTDLRRRQDWIFWYEFAKKGNACISLAVVLGSYRKDSTHSVSRNKLHMALIQWGLYRSYFGHSFFKSIRSFIKYFSHGIVKHYLN